MRDKFITERDVVWAAEMVATEYHRGQRYGIFPFTKHLSDVVKVLRWFNMNDHYLAAGWLHDTIEDTDMTYGKIKDVFGTNIALMVWGVTDEGKNRKEKKVNTYKKLQEYPDAVALKLADRIANVEHSLIHSNKEKLKMYKTEHEEFRDQLYLEQDQKMWDYLDGLIKEV